MAVAATRVLTKLFTRNSVKRIVRLNISSYTTIRRCLATAANAPSPSEAASAEAGGGLPLEKGDKLSEPSEERAPSEKVQRLVEEICGLTLLDVVDLNKALKKRLNLPDAPMMAHGPAFAAAMQASAAASAQAGGAAHAASPAPEHDVPQKMTFSVKLSKFDEKKKIALIKEIRNAIQGLNLVQAKKFVDAAPAVVREDMGKAEAEELKAALEKAGGVCEIV